MPKWTEIFFRWGFPYGAIIKYVYKEAIITISTRHDDAYTDEYIVDGDEDDVVGNDVDDDEDINDSNIYLQYISISIYICNIHQQYIICLTWAACQLSRY